MNKILTGVITAMLFTACVSQELTDHKRCCLNDVMVLGLNEQGWYYGSVPGVDNPTFKLSPSKGECNVGAIIKANFQKLGNCTGCQNAPDCGRRMLQVDLHLATSKGGFVFNIGDSVSNNGYGGDSNHQQNDAEIQGSGTSFAVYKSDKCLGDTDYAQTFPGQLSTSVTHIRLFISNEYTRIQTNQGMDEEICHECLFALNGQPDSGPVGTVNEDVYVAINRVVQSYSNRVGYGVCKATIQWACPWGYYNNGI